MKKNRPFTGIDFLLHDEKLIRSLRKRRVGLVTNQSALTNDYKPSATSLLNKLEGAVRCLLTPEHGWSSFMGDGVKIGNSFDHTLGLPILSLYGGEDKTAEWIFESGIDTFIIDLQDIGVRCYTYAATCAKLLEAFSGYPFDFILCDRPNPLGPQQSGPLLNSRYRSLVGYLNVPFVHGQTMGQLLYNFNCEKGKEKVSLTVISCQDQYQPSHYPWIPPSPGLPSWDSVLLYPALVLFEGTNISEGRGTSLPFTCVGAPKLDSSSLIAFLNSLDYQGIYPRPLTFIPSTGKLTGKECTGIHILIEPSFSFDAFSLGIRLLSYLKENYPLFEWTQMLNQKDRYFIDFLLGTNMIRESIDRGIPASEILKSFP